MRHHCASLHAVRRPVLPRSRCRFAVLRHRMRPLACVGIVAALAVSIPVVPVAAQNNVYNWVGQDNNNSNSWLSILNWLFNGSHARPTSNILTELHFDLTNSDLLEAGNDIQNGFILNNITFGGKKGEINIYLDALDFRKNAQKAATVILNSSAVVNLSTDITLTDPLTLSGTGLSSGETTKGSLTLSGVLSGAGGLIQNGSFTTLLSGANSYTGGTTVASGTLKLDSIGSWSSNTNLLLTGGLFDLNGTAPIIRNLRFGDGSVANAGNIIDSTGAGSRGAGIINLTGDLIDNNNRTGNTFSTAATVLGTDINLASGTHTLGGRGQFTTSFLTDTTPAQFTLSGVLSGAGNVTIHDNDRFAFTGVNTYTGTTTLNTGSVLFLGAGNAISSLSDVTVNTGAFLVCKPPYTANGVVSAPYDQTIGSLSGKGNVALGDAVLTLGGSNKDTDWGGNIYDGGQYGSVYKIGTSLQTFSAQNHYQGQTIISGGAIRIGTNDALLPASFLAVGASGTLDLNGKNQTVATLDGDGIVHLGGGVFTVNNTDVNAFPTFNGGFTAFGANGGLVKNGAGNFFLKNNGGDLLARVTDTQGNLNILASNIFDPKSVISISGNGTININGLTEAFGSLTGNGYVYLGNGGLTVGGSNADSVWGGNIYDNFNNGTLTKVGTGILALNASNNYTGLTTLAGGTIRTGTDSAFYSATSLLFTGGSLDLYGHNPSVTNITFGDGSVTQTGTINDSVGGGKLGVNGDITYNGAYDTSANPSTAPVVVNGGLALSAGQHNLTSNGVFSNGFYDLTLKGPISGLGGLNVQSGNFFAFAGQNTYTGATNLADNATLYLGAANSLPSGSAVTLGNGAYLYLNPATAEGAIKAGNYNQTIGSLAGSGTVVLGSATLTTGGNNSNTTFSGTITDSGSSGGLTKTGTGDLQLSGYSDYTGPTTVNGGLLTLTNAGALSDATALTVATGATLRLGSNDATFGSLAGGGTVRDGKSLTVGANNASTTFSGNLRDGSLTKVGSGTLALTGSSGYTGGTTISAGTLAANNTTGSATGTNDVTVGAGANLVGTGEINGNVINNGKVSPGAVFTGVESLVLDRNYMQSASAIFEEDLGGKSAGQFDLLTVKGTTALAGTLQIKTTNGYLPKVGDTFDFLSYSALSGTFNIVTDLDNRYTYTLVNNLSAKTLQIRVAAVPEPSLVATFGLVTGGGALSLLRRRRSRRA